MPAISNEHVKRIEAFVQFTLWENEPLSIGPKGRYDEAVLYFHGTPIAWRWSSMGVNHVHVNLHKYSASTNFIREELVRQLRSDGYETDREVAPAYFTEATFEKDAFMSPGWLRSTHKWETWTRFTDAGEQEAIRPIE